METPDFSGLKRLFIIFCLLVLAVGFALGVLVSCQRPIGAEKAIISTPISLSIDSLHNAYPDTIRAVDGPKTVVIGGKKVKVKKGGTLIVQTAPNSVSSVVGKAKAPVAVGPQSQATEVIKPQNSAITTGKDSPASTSVKESNNNSLLFILVAIVVTCLGGFYLWLKK
ncbi:hypothetical protein F1C16_05250 [Hymenobacter sp. NBH84]|uniref:hypothetical protein n=1 Tax=Hymenobacter sp. NBH84 TaxID=2596915 RepID=UPI001624CC7F|nr:hypothetical protein [Hymenobacter sp. NBH84]QNE39002.1 hypothetical protein F1C16_05250 [Hymenobacter sp. NBH84]